MCIVFALRCSCCHSDRSQDEAAGGELLRRESAWEFEGAVCGKLDLLAAHYLWGVTGKLLSSLCYYVRQWEISAAFPLFTYSEVDLHLESQLLSLHATAARK